MNFELRQLLSPGLSLFSRESFSTNLSTVTTEKYHLDGRKSKGRNTTSARSGENQGNKTYAEVAANISTRLAPVKSARDKAKSAVKHTTMPRRAAILETR